MGNINYDRKRKNFKIGNLNISFQTDNGKVNAIRGVNLDLYKGEIIAIVGESGTDKSVITKTIMGIMANNGYIDSGSIECIWHDEHTGEVKTSDIVQLNKKEMQTEIRKCKIAMVFQEPMTSLNPTMTKAYEKLSSSIFWRTKTTYWYCKSVDYESGFNYC